MQKKRALRFQPLLYPVLVLAVSSLFGIALRALNLQVVSSALYLTLMMEWCLMLQRRIMDKRIRSRLLCAALLMVLLFFFRICRYEIFFISPFLKRYFWYLYYLPFTGVPVFTLFAALCVGKRGALSHTA